MTLDPRRQQQIHGAMLGLPDLLPNRQNPNLPPCYRRPRWLMALLLLGVSLMVLDDGLPVTAPVADMAIGVLGAIFSIVAGVRMMVDDERWGRDQHARTQPERR